MTVSINVNINVFKIGLLIIFVIDPIKGQNTDPDFNASITDLIESRGFAYETHYIVTKDFYILGVYRLINPFVKHFDRSKLKPIVLQHGFMGTAVDFLINAPNGEAVACQTSDAYTFSNLNKTITNNLGFLLANLCYDVWLSNSRGNRYSRNHTTLNPDTDKEFWNFSFDEMIQYDSPAIIEHILTTTGYKSLGWIGHSQGTLIMFGLLADQPHYSLKVKPFIALAPVCYVNHIILALRIASRIPGLLDVIRSVGGELDERNPILKITEQISCGRWEPKVCEKLIYPLLGYNIELMNGSRIDIYRSQGYGGSSVWNMIQFGQNIITNSFKHFDYGIEKNKIIYGGPSPPKYPISQINSTQIALLYSKSDTLGDYNDVTRLIEALKVPLLQDYFVPLPSWNHLDFIYSEKVYEFVHVEILKILRLTY